MINVQKHLTPQSLLPALERFWEISERCITTIENRSATNDSAPVFTAGGRYTSQGWTEWTQGFQYGSALLQFDATGNEEFLELGRRKTVDRMAPHLTHTGVHDHGFNNVSTYGNLWRMAHEDRLSIEPWETHFYELALKVSGAVQASRWATTDDGSGYIYSFNGPQSLFVDTIRSCRALALSHQLGHVLMVEQDQPVSLLKRLIEHATNTARYNIWYGDQRDFYDVRGRTSHESLFNVNNGAYRCNSTQQGYSPFSTWTRGQAWAMLGYAELLEWLQFQPEAEFEAWGGRLKVENLFLRAAQATCDHYMTHTPCCGIPYWDTGAPGLQLLGDYQQRPAEPFNKHEPVDSSAAAIAAQGLIRLGSFLAGKDEAATPYRQAGLTVLATLLEEPYLSTEPNHEGLLLHSVYHRPNGWDYIPNGQSIPCGESSMWGDYHIREAALLVQRLAQDEKYPTFFGLTKTLS